MSWGPIIGIAAPVLTFLAIVIGLFFARSKEKAQRKADAEQKEADRVAAAAKEAADRKAAAEQAKADLEAAREREAYERMQEDRAADRVEMAAMRENLAGLQRDVTDARSQLSTLFSQFSAVRRELDAAEAHIADVHRWDDNGRRGAMPQRIKTVKAGE